MGRARPSRESSGRESSREPSRGTAPASAETGKRRAEGASAAGLSASPTRRGFSLFGRRRLQTDARPVGVPPTGVDGVKNDGAMSMSGSALSQHLHSGLVEQPPSSRRRNSLSFQGLTGGLLAREKSIEKGADEAAGHLDVDLLRLRLPPATWITPSKLHLNLESWDLDLYSCHGQAAGATEEELLAVALDLFKVVGIEGALGLPESTVQNFVLAVCKGYLPQPFHNFSHGVYVLQGCVVCLQRCPRLRQLLRPQDQLALCIAALGHDIGHMGVQNTFLVNSNDPLALMYNDKSVLESMHASKLFRILQRSDCKLFEHMSTAEFRELRKLMIGAILATDLSNHFADMTRFTTRMDNAENEPWSMETAADRQMAVDMVLHASDLAGPARPWHVSSVWSGKVQEEFVAQVDNERKLGLPVSSFLLAPKPKVRASTTQAQRTATPQCTGLPRELL